MTALELQHPHGMRSSAVAGGQWAAHRGDAIRDNYSRSGTRWRSARIATYGALLSPLRDHVRGDEPLEAGDVSGRTCPVEAPPDRRAVETGRTHTATKKAKSVRKVTKRARTSTEQSATRR